MHVECREASESGVDVSLRGLLLFVVVFFVKWEWGVVRDGVPDVVFCKSYGAHVGFVIVKCGAKVGATGCVWLLDRCVGWCGGPVPILSSCSRVEVRLVCGFPIWRSSTSLLWR